MSDKNEEYLADWFFNLPASAEEKAHWEAVAKHFYATTPEMRFIYPVALLHDVVEDGYGTIEEIAKRFKLKKRQIHALNAITRGLAEPYFHYIARVKANEIATKVKLADLEENMKRCVNDIPNRWGLLRRYAKAYAILTDQWEDDKLRILTDCTK